MSIKKTTVAYCESCGKERTLEYRSNRKPSPLCMSCNKKGSRNGHWKGGITKTSPRHNKVENLIKCHVCGADFTTTKSYSKYCSDECRKKAGRTKYLDNSKRYKKSRRLREKLAVGSYDMVDFEKLIEMVGYKCPRCGNKLEKDEFTVDHVIPYCDGGSNDITNIQPLCWLCNVQKNTRSDRYIPYSIYEQLTLHSV
jgi:5-methylcytosine-specific restriction endonuclease McrA